MIGIHDELVGSFALKPILEVKSRVGFSSALRPAMPPLQVQQALLSKISVAGPLVSRAAGQSASSKEGND
jgi:hypothetical protein